MLTSFEDLWTHVAENYIVIVSIILFGIGFTMLLFSRNLLK